jgi:hypothetical protein
VIYDQANQYINHDKNNNNWKRNNGGGEERGDWAYYGLIGDRTPIRGMESFAYNMGWVLLATILPSVIAFMVCLPLSCYLGSNINADDQFLSAETAKKQADAKPSEA